MGMPVQAIILAAGRGSRLGHLTAARPKALLELGGRALLDHVRQGLARAGVRRTIIVVGHRAEQVEVHLRAHPVPRQEAITVWQPVPQGTGQAVAAAVEALDPGPTWITYADIMVDPAEYERMAVAFDAQVCDMMFGVVKVEDPHQGAAVYFTEDHRITKIVEKPKRGTSSTPWNSAGIYISRHSLFPHLPALKPSARGEFELPDAIVGLIGAGGDVRAFPLVSWWADIGRPEDVERMNALLKQQKDEGQD